MYGIGMSQADLDGDISAQVFSPRGEPGRAKRYRVYTPHCAATIFLLCEQ